MDNARQSLLFRLQTLDAVLASSPLRLEQGGLGTPSAWFLGPKAENKDLLLELIAGAIAEHCGYRTAYHPEDPEMITSAVKESAEYVQAVETLRKSAAELNAMLKRSAPIFSMRSHGHMLWDQVLPAMVGYFAGMLYNQNNVAAEASPITTWLEIQVGNDLCRMLGYDVPAKGNQPKPGTIVPWGHITCGGTVANIEALWAARNAKFFAVALRAALREVPALAAARNIEVGLLDGSKAPLIDLDPWTLLNLKIDDVVDLPHRIAAVDGGRGLDTDLVAEALRPYALHNIGMVDFYRRFLPDMPAPIAIAPATNHYSWPKGGTLLGIGRNHILKVRVDMRARMHMPHLEERLRECLRSRTPVLAVVAVIGSTEESAVDPLRDILDMRQRFRREGLDFAVHCDAAWGGYFNSMYREEDTGLGFMAAAPEFPMSRYVAEQYRALREADSITVDPHKAGFVPYPAGSVCYRNSALRDLISLAAPVVFHSQSEPTVGIYGIEGSKPGAAAAAVYLAHKVIRPTKQGYGKILAQCVWTSKRMYCRLLTMQDRDPQQPSSFKIELVQMLPAERDGLGPEAVARQRALLATFVDLDNDQLLARLNADPAAMALFEEMGSDQVILAYAFNFRDPATGEWNTDPDKLNALNNRIYEICSTTDPGRDPNTVDLVVTGSKFDVESYGRDFVDHFGRRLGVKNPDGKSIAFLISTTMNPWTTDTPAGDFLEVVERALRDAVYKAINVAPYGSWRSPITAELMVQKSIRLGEVRMDGGDAYWLEERPAEKGRGVIVRLAAGDVQGADVTPRLADGKPSFDVRTRVYSYGGGAWLVDNGVVYFSNASDGRLYRQDRGSELPVPLTPSQVKDGRPVRQYADGVVDRGRRHWIGIVEDWSNVGPSGAGAHARHPDHRIVAIDLDGGQLHPGTVLVEDHDFFSSPRLSPDGRRLAWLAWDHPRMPWQGTTLFMAELDADGRPACAPIAVAGGSDEAVLQPEWSPLGTELWFISDRSGWWNLYRYKLANGQVEAITRLDAEFGQPQWTLGRSAYAFAGPARVVATYSRNGLAKLALVEAETGKVSDIAQPYSTIDSVRTDGSNRMVFVGGGARQPTSVVLHDLETGKQRVLKKATELADNARISRHFTTVEPIQFPTTDHEVAHGFYYPPFNADFSGPPHEKPPLVVMSHGGPTAQSLATLKLAVQYWTSRGIAVLDVNYRGSSGFGRAYRDRLKESWGIVDVEDCIAGARHLAERGLVDPERTVITGGSAGGFTTLAALTFHDYFKAGASHFGIGDLEALAKDTHKFESRYLDWLVGPYPEQIARYRERSPRYHVERLSRPVIFFQGEDDPVVPPNQTEAMVDAIRKKRLPLGYLSYAGEEHGFRQDDNVRRSIEAEHYFFAFQVFRSQLRFGQPSRKTPDAERGAAMPVSSAKIATGCSGLPASQGEAALAQSGLTAAPASAADGRPGNPSARRYAFGPAGAAGHHHHPVDKNVSNERHFHAFALLGEERLFASHLTMLDVEIHMYQFVIEVGLPEPWRSAYLRERRAHPRDSFFLANTLEDAKVGNLFSDPMTVPELQSRLRTCFVGNIFRGIPHKREYNEWPWMGVKPVLANVPVTVERIVHFRPFAEPMSPPCTLTYLLFGAGREAHMVHYQTKKPDYDHILSLQAAPDWLAQDMLAAGVVVDLPDLPRLGSGDHAAGVRCASPLEGLAEVAVRYRGTGDRRLVSLGHTYWFCTRVANHPDPCPNCNQPCGSPTPREYLST